MVCDVPHCITKQLWGRPRRLVHAKLARLAPGQCLEQGIRHFLEGFGVSVEGGRFVFPRANRAVRDVGMQNLLSAVAGVRR